MRRTLNALGITAAVGLVLAIGAATGGDAKGDDTKDELAKLKGTWVRELDGKTFILVFNGEHYALINEFAPEKTTATGTVTIDPTKKPKRIDIKITDGTGTGEKLKGKTALCIYQLDGDTLKFCINRPGQEGYPEQFPDKEGVDKYLFLVFKRAK
jgi:uncharacterized protein (TIGR03067 family)